MYIILDLERKIFVGKHNNLMNAFEMADKYESYFIFPFDDKVAFNSFTDEELQQIYINLTANNNGCIQLREIIIQIIISYLGLFQDSNAVYDFVIPYSEDYETYIVASGIPYNSFSQAINEPFKLKEPSSQPRERTQSNAKVHGEFNAPKNGACARIWEVATELWNSDPVIDRIQQIKKDARVILVGEGVNPSTVSVQLSKWMKTILN